MNERSTVLRRRDVGPVPASSGFAPLRQDFQAPLTSTAPRLGHVFNQISPVRPQPKLTVNRPGDKYEQEADSVADQVMRMGREAAALSKDGGQNAEKEEMQRTPLSPRTLDSVLQRAEEGEAQAADVSGIVQQGLSGGGQPLDGQTRSFMEPRFGHDFSRVRIHTDAPASRSADQVAARAYTVGNDIAFRAGDYSPGTSDGRRLLAHELTHVVQQGAAPPGPAGHSIRRMAVSPQGGGMVQRAPPLFNSGAPLNSPSYVNNQNPSNPGLSGPTASAGNSQFVVGGPAAGEFSFGGLLMSASKMKKSYDKFEKIAKMLEDQGKGTGGFVGRSEDKPLLAAAENITTFAKGVSGLSDALTTACNHPDAQAMKKGDNGVGYALNIIKAAEVVGNLTDSTESLAALHQKKDLASAEAWARNIGSAFDNLSGAFPSEGLPGFDVAYIKGLMQLPKNVINSFINVLEVHYGTIDEEAGISGASRRSYSILKDKITWEGDLCAMYEGAWTLPPANGKTLMGFMEEHRKSEGLDLWKVTVPVGRALLLAAIQRDGPAQVVDPKVVDAWLDYIGKA